MRINRATVLIAHPISFGQHGAAAVMKLDFERVYRGACVTQEQPAECQRGKDFILSCTGDARLLQVCRPVYQRDKRRIVVAKALDHELHATQPGNAVYAAATPANRTYPVTAN